MISQLVMQRSTKLTMLAFASAGLLFAGCAPKVEVTPDPVPRAAVEPATSVTPSTKPVVAPIKEDSSAYAKPSLNSVYFAFDSSDLDVQARTLLEAYAVWLNENGDKVATIEGNCDQRGTREYNLALGQRRADGVKDFLSSQGVDSNRIKTVSFGEEQPVCTDTGEACWAKNRHADITIR